MEQYQYVKDKFALLLFTHEFSLEKEIDLLEGGKETHYHSNNSRLIIGCSTHKNMIYTRIWLHTQWVKLQFENRNIPPSSFSKKVQQMEQEVETLLLHSLL